MQIVYSVMGNMSMHSYSMLIYYEQPFYQQGLSYLDTLSKYPNRLQVRTDALFRLYQCEYEKCDNKEDRFMLQKCIFYVAI